MAVALATPCMSLQMVGVTNVSGGKVVSVDRSMTRAQLFGYTSRNTVEGLCLSAYWSLPCGPVNVRVVAVEQGVDMPSCATRQSMPACASWPQIDGAENWPADAASDVIPCVEPEAMPR